MFITDTRNIRRTSLESLREDYTVLNYVFEKTQKHLPAFGRLTLKDLGIHVSQEYKPPLQYKQGDSYYIVSLEEVASSIEAALKDRNMYLELFSVPLYLKLQQIISAALIYNQIHPLQLLIPAYYL